MNIAVHICGTQ